MILSTAIFNTLFSVPTVIFVIGGPVAIIAVVATTVSKVLMTRIRERTRREIAAYVAEGTIDPDKAIEMLNAGRGSDSELHP